MAKITIATDADKADLIAQYQWAQDRLDEIVVEMNTVSAANLNTVAKLETAVKAEAEAIKDEALILRKTLRLLKKFVTHELR